MAAVVWPALKVGAACGMFFHVLPLPIYSTRSRHIRINLSLVRPLLKEHIRLPQSKEHTTLPPNQYVSSFPLE